MFEYHMGKAFPEPVPFPNHEEEVRDELGRNVPEIIRGRRLPDDGPMYRDDAVIGYVAQAIQRIGGDVPMGYVSMAIQEMRSKV
jgi:hypothetical protein